MHIVKMIAGKYLLSNGWVVSKIELANAMRMKEDDVKKEEAKKEQVIAQVERIDRDNKRYKRK